MTLGGIVRPVHAEWSTLSVTVTPFGLPLWMGTCRTTPGNAPPKTLKVTDVDCHAGVGFSRFGAFCGANALDPGSTAASFLNLPPANIDPGGSGSVGFSIPAIVAKEIKQDVKLILRTARGVRLINLGQPTVNVDKDGNVEFAVAFVDNCNYLTNDQLSLINWAKGKGTIDIELLDPPLEDPNWLRLLSAGRGIDVQMVSFAGLEPGELLSFRSADHAIDVTADAIGRAMVPVFLPLAEVIAQTPLQRVNRQSVAGMFRVRSVAFFRGPVLASGTVNQLVADVDGSARLTRSFEDRWTRHAFGIAGMATPAVEIAAGTGEASLNPQPLPPEPPPEAFLAAARQLPGLHEVVLIPGFESEPVAVARMKDGSAVLLQEESAGSVRVAGSFKGPIGAMAMAGNWGMSVAQDQVTMFEARRA